MKSVVILSHDLQITGGAPSLEEVWACPQTPISVTCEVLRQFWEMSVPELCTEVKSRRQQKSRLCIVPLPGVCLSHERWSEPLWWDAEVCGRLKYWWPSLPVACLCHWCTSADFHCCLAVCSIQGRVSETNRAPKSTKKPPFPGSSSVCISSGVCVVGSSSLTTSCFYPWGAFTVL